MAAHLLRKKNSLRWYLALFVSLIILIFTMILLLIPSGFFKKSFLEQAQNYCQNMIFQTATGVHTGLREFDDLIDKMVTDPDFINLMDPSLNETDKIYQYKNILQEYFPPTMVLTYYVKGIDFYIKDPAAHLLYGATSIELDTPFSSSYYETALNAPLTLNWNHTIEDTYLTISRIIYDFDTYEIKGLMLISVSPTFLQDKFNTYNTLEVDNFYILNEHSYIICAADQSKIGQLYQYYNKISSKNTDTIVGTLDSEDQLSVYCKSSKVTYSYPYHDWYVIIDINKNILLKDYYAIMKTSYLLTAAVIFLGIVISLQFSKYISRPIHNLAEKMSTIHDENLDIFIEEDTPFLEIAQMNQDFNAMIQRLNTLINTVYRTELAKKEAQFNALQAQINPHFLFNTMQLISWKANEYEAYPVCEMVQSLCYMLETTLSYRGEQTYSLHEELLYLQHYAKILHYKYLNKISLDFQIPEELLACQIPILTFQPFIENAVVHGLEPLQEGGTIVLSVKRDGENLVTTITDNGVGIRPDVLYKLQQNLPMERHQEESSYHMALHNIQTRIRLLYGENYGYTIKSTLYEGTCITLIIPYQTNEEN